MARIVARNWDEDCRADLMSGMGFEITEPAIKGTTKLYNGIQSERFCTDFDSEEGFSERYRCDKGCTHGKVFEGSICPICGGKVKFRDIDLRITGWMIIRDYTVIHPLFYHKLASIIGNKVFQSIIKYDKRVSKNGELEQRENTTSPFYGIGITEFRERFDEILEYYVNKKKGKEEEVAEILANRDKIFPHAIPVYTAVLRPMSFRGESLFYCTIDKLYNKIYSSVFLLNNVDAFEKRRKKWSKEKRERMDQGSMLSDIQDTLMELWDNIFDEIDSKYGHIQSEILGGMLNWSSRDVIIPNPLLKSDEVILNYMAVLELFKFEIIAYLCEMNDISPNEALEQWSKARIKYSSKIYEIMNYMIKSHTRYIIINRNPTKLWSFTQRCVSITI